MAVTLEKGQGVDLSKGAPGTGGALEQVSIGLGWATDADLDASVFLLGAGGKVAQDADFVFYNNLASPCGSVIHMGDERTGGGDDGDDEQIFVDLTRVPANVTSIVVAITLYENAQSFAEIPSAYVRVGKASRVSRDALGKVTFSADDADEIARYELQGDYSSSDALIFGALTRTAGGWQFQAIGEGRSAGTGIGGLGAIARGFGVNA